VILGYGGLLVIDGNIKVGVLATFLLYLQRFFDPLQDVSQFYNTFQSAASGLEKISGVLERGAAVPEPAAPGSRCRPGPGRGGPVRCASSRSPSATGTDSCCPGSTWTSRPGRRSPWSARPARARRPSPGCSAGSTTRAQGRVTLDGVDLRQLPDAALRSEIIVITQENFLFDGSVAENIRLGRPARPPPRSRRRPG
jgi:ATP-binding cassette subfamily B protein